MESLLRRGAEINVVDKEGVTPLMMASKLGNRDLVDILLDQGADISLKVEYTLLYKQENIFFCI